MHYQMIESAEVSHLVIPRSEKMFGYSTDLRSATQGRALYTMTFSHYEELPNETLQQILSFGSA
jgi:elongation factor G